MKIDTKVKKFVKYLRNLNIGVLDDSFSDNEILEMFRVCVDCGKEILTKPQQMHAIIEWDKPAKAFETLLEQIQINQIDCETESVLDDEGCEEDST